LSEKNLHSPFLQEIVAGSSEDGESKKIMKLVKEGKLKKIASRLYTSNLRDTPEAIIKRNWYHVLSILYPESIISHRSAFEGMPIEGHIFLTYKYSRNVVLPGLMVHLLKGGDKEYGAVNFIGDLYKSTEARAYLENMQTVQSTTQQPKTLDRKQIEEKLETVIRLRGESELNKIRDESKMLAGQLGLVREFESLNRIISALLATHSSKILNSTVAQARAFGEPFDPDRINLFQRLYEYLAKNDFRNYDDRNDMVKSYQNFAFFEAYFSNFIEGTEFAVDEAKAIIETDTPQPLRDEDSHDILGTYRIVADKEQLSRSPENAAELVELLRERHGVLLSARVSKKPGEFKDKNNRAGNTEFVDWRLVTGTLKKGFDLYKMLENPFAKAAYMMFLISEVHPFLDGNGRVARVMMNAELSARNLSKIIIPTVYRVDYLGAIKKLTKRGEPDTYVRMLERAYQFSSTVYGEDMVAMEAYLRSCNAFEVDEGVILRFQGRD